MMTLRPPTKKGACEMRNYKANIPNPEKLVDDDPLFIAGLMSQAKASTKRHSRIRRIADPHIRGHQVKGHIYYYYVRGADREIYLRSEEHTSELQSRLHL